MIETWLKRLTFLAGVLAFSCGDNTSPNPPPDTEQPPDNVEDKGDKTPPTFEGVTSAELTEDGAVLLSWDEMAEDNETPAERIVYRAYSGNAGEVDFSQAAAVSPAGASRVVVSGLAQAHSYEFVVRAVDASGNESDTTQSVQLTVPDTLVPQFAGVKTAEGKSGSELEVSWEPPFSPTPVDHYLVYISASPILPFTEKPIEVPGDSTSLVIDDLTEASPYHVAVRAVDERGAIDGNRRFIEGRTLDVTAPTFAGLESAAAGGTAVRLTWTPAEDNITPASDIVYRIFSGETSETIDYETPLAEVTGLSTFVLTGLTPSTSYSFNLRAVDAAGNESASPAILSAVTGAADDTTPPLFAGAVKAITLSSGSIQVTWSAATDDLTPQSEIVYDVWVAREAVSPDTTEPNASSLPGATSFDVVGLEPNTFYNFVVRARDIAGLRDDNTASPLGKTKQDDDPPFFAGVSSVIGTSATTLQVTWDAATDANPGAGLVYDVYLATTTGGQNFAVPSRTVVGLLSTSFSGLTRNTTYYAVVRVTDPDGNVNESNVEAQGATLQDTTAPELASTPSVNAASETSIAVTWNAATDDSYLSSQLQYQVQYRVQNVGNFVNWGGLVSGAGALGTTITGLQVSTTYQVRIIPRDGIPNIGIPSPVGIVTTSNDVAPPTFAVTPTLSGTSSVLFNQVTVSWSPASDNVSAPGSIFYEVCYSTTSNGCDVFSVGATTTPGTTSAAISSLPWGTPYYFRVRAVDQAGNRTVSIAVTDLTAPVAFTAPTLAVVNGTSLTVNNGGTSDSVFTNLRYRADYVRGTVSGTVCGFSWSTGSISFPSTGATSVSIPRVFGSNQVQMVAIDGFGNERYTTVRTLTDSTASAAHAIIPPLWTANCQGVGCHGGLNSSYPAWTMANVFSSSPVTGGSAVIVANSLNSRMYRRTTGQGGSLMPSGASAPVDDMVCNLQRWILAGAPH